MTAEERSAQLLDVAEGLFVAKGFDRTSIGDIAAAAGVTRPIVYEHHGSKEGVYLAALERAKGRIAADYATALAGVRQPQQVLRIAADVYFSIVERDPARWLLLYGGTEALAGESGARQEAIQASNAGLYTSTIGGWVRDDVSRVQLDQVVHMMWGAAGALARWWLVNPQVPRQEVVGSYADLCWSALAPLLAEAHRG